MAGMSERKVEIGMDDGEILSASIDEWGHVELYRDGFFAGSCDIDVAKDAMIAVLAMIEEHKRANG